MTTHRLANIALFVLIFAAWAIAMDSDYAALHEPESDAVALAQMEQRMWLHAVQHCHRAFGPGTQPEYDAHDRLVCVGKRGHRHIEVAIPASELQVASK
jgi:hypothetical protein